MAKFSYKVIGVMSGTSLDGMDIIYATYTFNKHWAFKIHCSETIRYSAYWTSTLAQLVNKSMEELQDIDNGYSEYVASVIAGFIERHTINEIDFVASHGHTALHQPQRKIDVSDR